MKTIFIVEIEVMSDEWHYKKGDIIPVPVLTSSKYHAQQKVEKKFCGSEYPLITVLSIEKTDTFLFKPIL